MISKKNWEALETAISLVIPAYGNNIDESLIDYFGDLINNIITAAKGPTVKVFDCFNEDFWHEVTGGNTKRVFYWTIWWRTISLYFRIN